MLSVAILGAGELGGALCHTLAQRDVVSSIRLIDDRESIAKGKALDIQQSAPILNFATAISGTSDVYTAAGSDVIVVADRAGAGDWQGDDGLMLVRRVAQFERRSTIVCAGASQRELVERAVRELKLSMNRIVGSAPEALASAIRALVAVETNGSPRDVSLTVLGVPPAHVVVPWEEATVAGFAVTRILDEPSRRRLAARVTALWPPGPQALAAAGAAAVEGLIGRSRAAMSCFVAPDDSSGVRSRAGALPVRLGPSGIAGVIAPRLNSVDRVALENALQL